MIEADHLDDHRQPAFVVDTGVGVRGTDHSVEQGLIERVDALSELARALT